LHEDGTRQLWFPSGNSLKISPDGTTRTVVFYNGDIQETLALEGLVRYFYAESKAWHETYGDGTQIITFPK
jgi:centromere protein J